MARRLMSAIAATALAASAAGSRPPVQHQMADHPSAAGSPAGYQACAAEADLSYRGVSYVRCVQQEAALSTAVMRRLSDLSAHPDQAGCLGKDEVTCLATLARSVVVTTSLSLPTELVTSVPSDINGRPTHAIVKFSAYDAPPAGIAKPARVASIMLWLSKDALVAELEVSLPSDPFGARTPAEWDATGIYDFARAVLGPACISEDRVTFYRGADATMKGETASASADFSGGPDASIGQTVGSSTSRCGTNIRFASVGGQSAMYGAYGGGMINFSVPPTD